MKRTVMNRETMKLLNDAVDAALKPVADAWGLTVSVNGGRFDATTFKPKIEFKTAEADAANFAKWAPMFNLDPADLGRSFRANGQVYTIVALKPAARTRPVVTESHGKQYVWPSSAVLTWLTIAEVK